MGLLLNAAFMLIATTVSTLNHFDAGFFPLLLSFLVTTAMGAFPLIFVPVYRDISLKESYVIVALSWLLCCAIGMLPYLLWGGEFSITKAWFESVSGYTTTGATSLTNIDSLPLSIRFWRSSTQWIGGGGVVLFALVVLPSLGKVHANLSKIEMSSLSKLNVSKGVFGSLRSILMVYIGLTILQSILLCISGLGVADAIGYTFSTISTGGFAMSNSNVAGINNSAAEIIIFVFMVISGLNFSLIFASFMRREVSVFRSGVAKFYLLSILIGALVLSVGLRFSTVTGWADSFRHGFFQIASLASSTGFYNANTTVWPPFAIMLLILFMMQAGCAGSTSGGIKVDRIVLFISTIKTQIKRLQHPNAVIPVRIGKTIIADEVVNSSLLFIVFYIIIIFISTVVLGMFGLDILSSFSASAACMGNVGPGFGLVGTMGNYGSLPNFSMWWLTLLMLLGRLEIYGLLMVVFIRSWK
jgi:Trk-type K+ transport systems, membrane components